MPRKHVPRPESRLGIFHVYNRGNEKQTTFIDVDDFQKFMFLLKGLLTGMIPHGNDSLEDQIQLVAYCLMSNHYHLLLRANTEEALTKLMRSLSTRYTAYFNRRHRREGNLFQGPYRARPVEDEADLLNLSKYIHLNALDLGVDIKTYRYSSLRHYLNSSPEWLRSDLILAITPRTDYEKFVLAA